MNKVKKKVLTQISSTFFVVLTFLLISCQSQAANPCPENLNKKSDAQTECWITAEPHLHPQKDITVTNNSELPEAALKFTANATLVNFNPDQQEKVRQATELIKKVIATKEFRDGVLNHTWEGKKQFVDNKGLSNEEIYQLVLDASESYKQEKNNSLDVELELYHEMNTTIGYTFPYAKRIWMNKKYFERYTAVQVSDNLFHEWVHKLGFDHEVKWSKKRDYTVPYALGYLVERIAADIEKKDSLKDSDINLASSEISESSTR